jgi:alkyldihydroxyacetonephosphate synthase
MAAPRPGRISLIAHQGFRHPLEVDGREAAMAELPPRRWNGWGDPAIEYAVPEGGLAYLQQSVGVGAQIEDASYDRVLASVPPSRLAAEAPVETDPAARLTHARGQSLPDWVALRSGRIGTFPDGVAYPRTDQEVRQLLDFAARQDVHLIPYGGGTSVVGHINPAAGDRPVLTVDLRSLDRMLALDEVSRLATFEAGASGPSIESRLAARGFTLGHFPQSFEGSTLGGWIATHSSGQQSMFYGRMEDLFAGGHLETPVGPLELASFPASAAGPDLRQLALGSEGRLGVLTRAVVRIRPRPSFERFSAVFFHTWEEGLEAVRRAVQGGLPASMLRLSDSIETETTMRLGGRPAMVKWAKRGLEAFGYGGGPCLLILGATGHRLPPLALGGLPAGRPIGEIWRRSRFRSPYLRNSLWEAGYALDTVETAVPWTQVAPCAEAMVTALRSGLHREGERVLTFAHLSHVYPDGASVYATYLFRRTPDPDQTLERWRILKGAATRALLSHGGTISHQHGVGSDHVAYLSHEKGLAGLSALAAACRALDPGGLMNPGKLLI